MKCDICGTEITYDPPNAMFQKGHGVFITVIESEMVWGEQSIYPMEIHRSVVCSKGCVGEWIKRRK